LPFDKLRATYLSYATVSSVRGGAVFSPPPLGKGRGGAVYSPLLAKEGLGEVNGDV